MMILALCVGLRRSCGFLASLILDKMLGRRRFADVVIERTDARQEAVAADNAAGFFGKLADGVRMLVRPRRPHRELAENRQIGV